MTPFRCLVYNFNDIHNPQTAWLGPYFAPVVCIGEKTLLARSEREAASLAYISVIGRKRARYMKYLNAPEIIILPESSATTMAHCLQKTTIWIGDCFLYDTHCEQFYIKVGRIERYSWPRSLLRRRYRILKRRQLLSALKFCSRD